MNAVLLVLYSPKAVLNQDQIFGYFLENKTRVDREGQARNSDLELWIGFDLGYQLDWTINIYLRLI